MSQASRLLRGITEPVMGCTEPAAIALATSLGAAAAEGRLPSWTGVEATETEAVAGWPLPEDIELISVRTTRSLYKNAMAVGLPNTNNQSGISLAAALGAFLPADSQLNLLKETEPERLEEAQKLIGAGRVVLEVDDRDEEVWVEATIIALVMGARHVGQVVIQGRHDRVVRIRRDGRLLLNVTEAAGEGSFERDLERLSESSLEGVIRLAAAIDESDETYLLTGVNLNREAARLGLEKRLGVGLGCALADMREAGYLGATPVTEVRIQTAAACDARMSGYEVEIMASGGSGNQGVMATIPAAILGDHLRTSARRLAEALALSHLVTAVMTVEAGLLGGMCGCVVKAGIGAAAAAAYLLSDRVEVVDGAIDNMAANIVGEICDGAKGGCALKLSTSAGTAVEAALLANQGISIPSTQGIVGRRAFDTLTNIGQLARSMREVDRRIVELMQAKVG